MSKNLIKFGFKNFNLINTRLLFTSATNEKKWFYRKKKDVKILSAKSDPRIDNITLDTGVGIRDISKNTLRDIESLEGFNDLPDNFKTQYTYGFYPIKLSYKHQLEELLKKFDVSETNNPFGYKVVRNCLLIRYWRGVYKENKNIGIRNSILNYLRHQKKLLEQLRFQDGELFLKLVAEFNLKHDLPTPIIHYRPKDDRYKKLLTLRNECKKGYKLKDKELREDYEESYDKFKNEKHQELLKLKNELNELGLNIEDLLYDMLDDRQTEMMRPVDEERYKWFEDEKRFKKEYEENRKRKIEERESIARR